jgi:hypothetical protein
MAETYVYLLPLHGEDWLKLGKSCDPLRRAREFSDRFHDEFDFDQAMLVQFDSEREAAATELALRRQFVQHNAPMPLTMRFQAGGHTEWFRGAHAGMAAAITVLESAGHIVHRPARPWFARAMFARRAELHGWASALLREHLVDPDESLPGPLAADVAARLTDALDAYRSFGIAVEDLLPQALHDWPGRLASRQVHPNDTRA